MESSFTTLVSLPQHLGVDEARALSAELDRRLPSDQPCVIFDFSSLKQIDSAGLEMLLRSMKKIARNDGAVQLGEVSPEAETMLELARMDGIFDMFPRINSETVNLLRVVPANAVVEEMMEEEEVRGDEPQPLAA
jgi:anti-anti-sigma factor